MVSPRRNFSLFYNLWSDLAGCSHCLTPRCKSDPLACAWTGCLPRWTRAKSLHSLLRPQSYGALVPLQDCNLSPHPGWRAKLVPICSLQSYSGQSHAGMVTVTTWPSGHDIYSNQVSEGREASQYFESHSFALESGRKGSLLWGLAMAKPKEKQGVGILHRIMEVIHLHTPKQWWLTSWTWKTGLHSNSPKPPGFCQETRRNMSSLEQQRKAHACSTGT